jgi:hypothetical protein
MGAQGTALLDFGAFPGGSHVDLDVATAGVISTSQVEAWIQPADTADHLADEHVVETLKVFGRYKAAGTITITGVNTSQLNEPLTPHGNPFRPVALPATQEALPMAASIGGKGTRIYGKWNVGWVWNG